MLFSALSGSPLTGTDHVDESDGDRQKTRSDKIGDVRGRAIENYHLIHI